MPQLWRHRRSRRPVRAGFHVRPRRAHDRPLPVRAHAHRRRLALIHSPLLRRVTHAQEALMARRSPSQYNWSKLRFDETILRKHFTSQSSKNVRFIVVHHSTIIGNGSGSALTAMYNVWQNRPASAHYGVDGRLVRQYVWDKDYAWATGSTVG